MVSTSRNPQVRKDRSISRMRLHVKEGQDLETEQKPKLIGDRPADQSLQRLRAANPHQLHIPIRDSYACPAVDGATSQGRPGRSIDGVSALTFMWLVDHQPPSPAEDLNIVSPSPVFVLTNSSFRNDPSFLIGLFFLTPYIIYNTDLHETFSLLLPPSHVSSLTDGDWLIIYASSLRSSQDLTWPIKL